MKKQPKFVIRKSDTGQFYAQFVAANGKEVWRTSETYKRKAGVIKAIKVLDDTLGANAIDTEDLT